MKNTSRRIKTHTMIIKISFPLSCIMSNNLFNKNANYELFIFIKKTYKVNVLSGWYAINADVRNKPHLSHTMRYINNTFPFHRTYPLFHHDIPLNVFVFTYGSTQTKNYTVCTVANKLIRVCVSVRRYVLIHSSINIT